MNAAAAAAAAWAAVTQVISGEVLSTNTEGSRPLYARDDKLKPISHLSRESTSPETNGEYQTF